ncbi:2'-5' RNA ligase family protein [uncultured Winogradskyella sp.]|uniref:2'-5' RNA ligase family protein n=1 Tax=uncultured Winogradskyella sp. TaxID=395353 RepID=UPI0026302D4F|nr:2'-5' RNA ligase family protein [uncultured Winogradskyella sp.]
MIELNRQIGFREYLITLNIPEFIKEDVKKCKKEFHHQFGEAKYLKSEAHISLSHFLIESVPEITIHKELKNYFSNWKKFNVSISGFGEFSESRTIFLNPSDYEIIKLQNHLRTVLRQRIKIAKKFTQAISKPHITIASDISKKVYGKCRDYYNKMIYENNFCVDGITILSRNHSLNETHYAVAFRISFNTR